MYSMFHMKYKEVVTWHIKIIILLNISQILLYSIDLKLQVQVSQLSRNNLYFYLFLLLILSKGQSFLCNDAL